MKILKMKKRLVSTVLVLMLSFTVFFFWASSPNLDEHSYAQLISKLEFKSESRDSVFSIITYNLGYLSGMTNNLPVDRNPDLFSNNLTRLSKRISVIDPDIIAFQEIDFNASRSYDIDQLNAVMDFGYPYAAKTINWDETYLPFPYGLPSKHFGKVISGQAITSKFEVLRQDRIVLTRPESTPWYRDAFYLERLAQVAKVIINDKEVVIINVHLEAYDEVARRKQAEEVLEIYEQYEKVCPTILLGDFNSAPGDDGSAINLFLNHEGLESAALSSGKYAGTFNSANPTERIDYIFYNSTFINYVDGEVLNEFGDISDHLPVIMEFKLK